MLPSTPIAAIGNDTVVEVYSSIQQETDICIDMRVTSKIILLLQYNIDNKF